MNIFIQKSAVKITKKDQSWLKMNMKRESVILKKK